MTVGSYGALSIPGIALTTHGSDHFFTSIRTIVEGKHIDSATSQLLQKTGLSHNAATNVDNILSIGGTGLGLRALRTAQLASFPRYSLPEQTSSTSNINFQNGFFGRRGFELKQPRYQSFRNNAKQIQGRPYSGHALDHMQSRGLVPSVVEDGIKTGRVFLTTPGTVGYYGSTNNIKIILNANTGRIVTVIPGAPK